MYILQYLFIHNTYTCLAVKLPLSPPSLAAVLATTTTTTFLFSLLSSLLSPPSSLLCLLSYCHDDRHLQLQTACAWDVGYVFIARLCPAHWFRAHIYIYIYIYIGLCIHTCIHICICLFTIISFCYIILHININDQ